MGRLIRNVVKLKTCFINLSNILFFYCMKIYSFNSDINLFPPYKTKLLLFNDIATIFALR